MFVVSLHRMGNLLFRLSRIAWKEFPCSSTILSITSSQVRVKRCFIRAGWFFAKRTSKQQGRSLSITFDQWDFPYYSLIICQADIRHWAARNTAADWEPWIISKRLFRHISLSSDWLWHSISSPNRPRFHRKCLRFYWQNPKHRDLEGIGLKPVDRLPTLWPLDHLPDYCLHIIINRGQFQQSFLW